MVRQAVIVLALFAATPLAAQDTRPSRALCDSAKLAGRAYFVCLEKQVYETNTLLENEVKRINGIIDGRGDLAGVQKNRWKNSLEEAQILYVRLRNQECQTVAPFEGENNRIGSFAERLRCLIDKNIGRVRELESRYGKP